MNLIEWFFKNAGLYFFYELTAALVGTYFYIYYAKGNLLFKYLMIFLWWTWFADSFAKYDSILYLTEYQVLDVRNTIFERSGWVYNIITIISIIFYSWYFKQINEYIFFKKIIIALGLISVLVSVLLHFTSGHFWIMSNGAVVLVATFLVMIGSVLFFFNLLKSERFISFYKLFGFYFTIGIFTFYLITTPLFIYSKYFTWDSYDFTMLRIVIMKFCNVLLYSTIIIGYLIAMKYKDLNLKFTGDAT